MGFPSSNSTLGIFEYSFHYTLYLFEKSFVKNNVAEVKGMKQRRFGLYILRPRYVSQRRRVSVNPVAEVRLYNLIKWQFKKAGILFTLKIPPR